MYNQQIINKRLDKIQPTLNFQLTRYSYEETSRGVDYINNLINFPQYEETLKSKSKVKIEFKSPKDKKEFYSEAIQQFIQNELILSKYDCFYWMEHYYKISDITNRFVQYKHTIPQQIWAKIFSRLEGLGRAIRLLVEKARQTTCTTFAQGVVEHRLQFYEDVKSMIASADQTSSGKMALMFTDSMDRQPFWLRPKAQSYEAGEKYIYENGSGLYIGYGTQKSLAKGTTCTVSHLSELALYKYPIQAIENALMRAMHETIRLLQIFEGTAEARDDWFHTKVKETIKGMEKGTSSLYFSFIPYLLRPEIYPPPAYIAGRTEAFANFIPTTETLAHAKKAENWIKANPDMVTIVGSNYRVSKETLFWYQTERNAAIERDLDGTRKLSVGSDKGELATFLSQCPADWEEAFQHAGKTIYPITLITNYADKAQSRIPEVYKLRGDPTEVNPDLFPEPDEIKPLGKLISIRSNYDPSIPSSDFQLVEIKFDGWDKFDPTNKILIWEHPKDNFTYGAAIDPSDGLGRNISDDAIMEIFRKGTVEFKDRQVCEFATPDLQQANFWPFALALATYYSPKEQLLLSIEVNDGYELQNAMINRGWWNLFQPMDEGKVGQDMSKLQKYGFETNGATRGALIGHFSTFFKGNQLDLFSMPLIGEIKDLQKIRRISAGAKLIRDRIEGAIDNRFMATGICLYSLHRNEIAGYEKASWEERQKNEVNKFEMQRFVGYDFEKLTNYDLTDDVILSTVNQDEYLDNLQQKLEDFSF